MTHAYDHIIRVQGLVTRFGRHTVHDGLNLDVRRGEIIGGFGGSGTGKSVLLRAIVGLLKPEAGKIEVFGQSVRDTPEADFRRLRRRWGVMFQDGALFSSLTVQQNVEAPMREQLDMAPDLRCAQRSRASGFAWWGCRKTRSPIIPPSFRAACASGRLARAIASDPEIVFLDEPTAGLDPIGAAAFDILIKQLQAALGLTVFLVTHDLDSLYAICDRVAALADKRVLAVGTMEDMLAVDHPWVQEYFHGPRHGRHRAAAGAH